MKTKGNENGKPKDKFPRLLRKAFRAGKRGYYFAKDKVTKSLRLELILTFGICLILAFFSSSVANSTMNSNKSDANIDYSEGIDEIASKASSLSKRFENQKLSIKDEQNINQIIKSEWTGSKIEFMIIDIDGNVLYSSNNVTEKQVDIYNIIKNITTSSTNEEYTNTGKKVIMNDNKEYETIYPVSFTDSKAYVVVKGVPEGEIVYENNNEGSFIAVLFGFFIFLASFYFITSRKMQYIETISNGLLEISKGDLNFKINKKGQDELAYVAENINIMTEKLKDKAEKEREAEKIKSELITNVSHDLRTPLTSIKGYLGLIKYKNYSDDNQLDEYINIAYNKSEKLELLINDLFEYTKLSNKALVLKKENIVINDLMQQLTEELVPICEENSITIDKNFGTEKIEVFVDPNKMVRVFENLLMNAIRYSIKPGTITIDINNEDEFVSVCVTNKCNGLSKQDINKLFERFYRAEKSRSGETGGSGLGLAIAKSIVELHNGSIQVDYNEPDICFTVKLLKQSKN